MKKGEVQQVFVYLFFVVVIGIVFLVGYNSVDRVSESGVLVQEARFRSSLESEFNRISFGSSRTIDVGVPGGVDQVCFVDPDSFVISDDYPVISAEVRAGTGYTVFLIRNGFVEPFLAKEITVSEGIFCANASNGRVSMVLSGLSRGRVGVGASVVAPVSVQFAEFDEGTGEFTVTLNQGGVVEFTAPSEIVYEIVLVSFTEETAMLTVKSSTGLIFGPETLSVGETWEIVDIPLSITLNKIGSATITVYSPQSVESSPYINIIRPVTGQSWVLDKSAPRKYSIEWEYDWFRENTRVLIYLENFEDDSFKCWIGDPLISTEEFEFTLKEKPCLDAPERQIPYGEYRVLLNATEEGVSLENQSGVFGIIDLVEEGGIRSLRINSMASLGTYSATQPFTLIRPHLDSFVAVNWDVPSGSEVIGEKGNIFFRFPDGDLCLLARDIPMSGSPGYGFRAIFHLKDNHECLNIDRNIRSGEYDLVVSAVGKVWETPIEIFSSVHHLCGEAHTMHYCDDPGCADRFPWVDRKNYYRWFDREYFGSLCVDGSAPFDSDGKAIDESKFRFLLPGRSAKWYCQGNVPSRSDLHSEHGTICGAYREPCPDGYERVGNTCSPPLGEHLCLGMPPEGKGVLNGSFEYMPPPFDKHWTYVPEVIPGDEQEFKPDLEPCEWRCAQGYEREGNRCVREISITFPARGADLQPGRNYDFRWAFRGVDPNEQLKYELVRLVRVTDFSDPSEIPPEISKPEVIKSGDVRVGDQRITLSINKTGTFSLRLITANEPFVNDSVIFNVPCICSGWENRVCGPVPLISCSATRMSQRRECPFGCDITFRCAPVEDSANDYCAIRPDFDYSPKPIISGQTANFRSTSKGADKISQYSWSIDGDHKATGNTFAYYFGRTGEFDVELLIGNAYAQRIFEKTIEVKAESIVIPSCEIHALIGNRNINIGIPHDYIADYSWSGNTGDFSVTVWSPQSASAAIADHVSYSGADTSFSSFIFSDAGNAQLRARGVFSESNVTCEVALPINVYPASCGGSMPSGAGVVLGDNTYSSLSYNPKVWSYTSSSGPGACQWTCANGFERDGNTCRQILPAPACSIGYLSVPSLLFVGDTGSSVAGFTWTSNTSTFIGRLGYSDRHNGPFTDCPDSGWVRSEQSSQNVNQASVCPHSAYNSRGVKYIRAAGYFNGDGRCQQVSRVLEVVNRPTYSGRVVMLGAVEVLVNYDFIIDPPSQIRYCWTSSSSCNPVTAVVYTPGLVLKNPVDGVRVCTQALYEVHGPNVWTRTTCSNVII